MNEHPFLAIIAIILIFESIMPLLLPKQWKELLKEMVKLTDNSLRIIAGVAMLIGIIIFQYIQL